jgi:hypothetical protein
MYICVKMKLCRFSRIKRASFPFLSYGEFETKLIRTNKVPSWPSWLNQVTPEKSLFEILGPDRNQVCGTQCGLILEIQYLSV